jgi:uncharacterized OB-fold protein
MAELPRPLPLPDRDTAPFWEAMNERELRFQRCSGCGAFRYPVGPLCPACRSFEFDWVASSGRGHIYSYTVVQHQTHPAFPVPYTVLLVEMEEGPRLVARLRDGHGPIEIGASVRVGWERAGEQMLPVFELEGGQS